MIWPTFIRGSSEDWGSWKIICISERVPGGPRRRGRPDSPLEVDVSLRGSSRRRTVRPSVLFAAAGLTDEPERLSPGWISRETSSTASTVSRSTLIGGNWLGSNCTPASSSPTPVRSTSRRPRVRAASPLLRSRSPRPFECRYSWPSPPLSSLAGFGAIDSGSSTSPAAARSVPAAPSSGGLSS